MRILEGDITQHRGLRIQVIRNHTTGHTQIFIETDDKLVTEKDLKIYINDELGLENGRRRIL